MITFYNEKDLVSFGNYLLSKERQELVNSCENNCPCDLEVSHADFENWKLKQC